MIVTVQLNATSNLISAKARSLFESCLRPPLGCSLQQEIPPSKPAARLPSSKSSPEQRPNRTWGGWGSLPKMSPGVAWRRAAPSPHLPCCHPCRCRYERKHTELTDIHSIEKGSSTMLAFGALTRGATTACPRQARARARAHRGNQQTIVRRRNVDQLVSRQQYSQRSRQQHFLGLYHAIQCNTTPPPPCSAGLFVRVRACVRVDMRKATAIRVMKMINLLR